MLVFLAETEDVLNLPFLEAKANSSWHKNAKRNTERPMDLDIQQFENQHKIVLLWAQWLKAIS